MDEVRWTTSDDDGSPVGEMNVWLELNERTDGCMQSHIAAIKPRYGMDLVILSGSIQMNINRTFICL